MRHVNDRRKGVLTREPRIACTAGKANPWVVVVAAALGLICSLAMAQRAGALPSEPSFAAPVANPFGLSGGLRVAFGGLLSGRIDAIVSTADSLAFYANVGTAASPAFIPTEGGIVPGDNPAPAIGNLNGRFNSVLAGAGDGEILSLEFGFLGPNPFDLMPVQGPASLALADLDADGDADLLVGTAAGDVLYFQNVGTLTTPAFAAPVTNPFGLVSVGAAAVPAVGDLDRDGDADLLVGSMGGGVFFFQNVGSATAPTFAAPVANPFGLLPATANSAPTLVDIDGDGDMDVFVADGGRSELAFYRNDAVRAERVLAKPTVNVPSIADVGNDAVPTLGDIDGDGDLDLFIGNQLGDLVFFRNIGSATAPVFDRGVNNPFGLKNEGTFAVPALGDLDLDGDLDMVVGLRNGDVIVFRNDGTPTAPEFHVRLGDSGRPDVIVNVGDFAAPTLGDLDDDLLPDVLVGNYAGAMRALTYQPGFDRFVPLDSIVIGTVVSRAIPTLVDFDGDGDLDVLVGAENGDSVLFRNIGSTTAPAFDSGVVNPLGLVRVGGRAAPRLADLDRDGDLDALVGAIDGTTIMLAGGPIPPPATETPTATVTATRADTRTQTATPTDVPVTAAPTGTSTAVSSGCPGDCNGSGDVSIADLVVLVNIALSRQPVSLCLAGDLDHNGSVAISELVAAVRRAQRGCAAAP